MKIKKNLCWLFMAAAILLAGCGSKQEEEKGYTVYYVNTAGTRLMEVNYKPAAQTFDEMMEELLGELAKSPAGYVSALPEGVEVNGYERGIDALRIDFSKEYYGLNNIDEVLLRAAIVKTFSQIPGVTKVMITVDKQQLVDSEGQPVPAMDANAFIDTKEGGINSYQYATLSLYFANQEGDQVVKEMRNLHYSSNMVLERVVVEQLIKGPENSDLKPVLGSNVKIQNVYIQKGICAVNFDEEVNKAPSESALDAETALYAIVNSICATCDDITGVRFEINGDSDVDFRGKINLNQIFMMNNAIIEKEEMETEEEMAQEVNETAPEPETQIDGTISGNPVVGIDPSLIEE